LVTVVLASLAACAVGPAVQLAPSALAAALAELRTCADLAGSRIGVHVVDLADGVELAALDADRGFATASNLKCISAFVGLTTLGADATLATELWRHGAIEAGVLHGDVVLRGGGDPSFGLGRPASETWAPFVAALQQSGVRRIAGQVRVDDGWLGDEHLGLGWQWDYLDEDYAAPFGALCLDGNVVRLRCRAMAGRVVVDVSQPGYEVATTEVRIDDVAAPRLFATRALASERIVLRGSVAANGRPTTAVVTVPDPSRNAARSLTAALLASGIEIAGSEAASATQPVRVHTSHSPPLRDLVVPLLRDSDNLHAEQFLRLAARKDLGDGGTSAAERHAKAVLAAAGVDPIGMVLADGSGLSRRNLVEPRQLTGVLRAARASAVWEPFWRALPVAGRTGTLRQRFTAGAATGRVRAKTGFISRVVCLSGFVPRRDEAAPPVVFSVMLNDFTCDDAAAKRAVDAFVQRLVAAVDAEPIRR
jgi:D-alanyl-D-alanine carboxypeptidase/D-alanyl-D-alanine-endopeptidase (penicillin-binding protein 4)